ncbi:MscS mechanosensitive ion channel [Novosphingobium nitrogenifigens DSM 19370]|uniref:MscS mechanosensitive ion channel n=1 Tax=Novosphingobium nitrogenifigens DSM 19370 TaxID=983920 RepID=F1ZDA0_9SPHN|nr:mechanosensitive ion channel domain-containing protein [Novosphingobium nitrogenifigens]EGD57458.1 MscS mechanosensitive ion channel [Novosphingobium nitrogenifigens DSM 19370]
MSANHHVITPAAIARHPLVRQTKDAIQALDDISIDIGHYHLSLLNALWMAMVVILAFALAQGCSKLARRLVRQIKGLDPTQMELGEKGVTLGVWAFAFLATIDALGISLTAFTVFSGAFGLAIGFGLQKTFGNLIAGIIILMDRSIKPGDVIAVNDGTMGVVRKIGIRAATVTALDNREYLIPNEILMTSQVENWSYSSREVSISVPVGISYDSDLDLAEKLLLEAAHSVERVLATPAPSVIVSALGPSSIDLTVSVWILDPERGVGGIRSQVLKAALRLFKENGVEIPFPQQDLRLRNSEGLQALAGMARRPDPAG